MKRAENASIARPLPKAISPSPIADICIPKLWRMFWSRAPISSCARPGEGHAGTARMVNPSISWLLSRRRRAAALKTSPSGFCEKTPGPWRFGLLPSVNPRRRPRRRGRKRGLPRHGKVTPSLTARWPRPSGLFLSLRLPQKHSRGEVGELYRSRWRIELAFKRLKSLTGLSAPPSEDPQTVKTWILAHLLMALLIEPHASAPEISPRVAA